MPDRKESVARRTLLGGVATVGTLAVAATLLPGQKAAAPAVGSAQPSADEASGGYRLTEHVKQYYSTARI